VKSKKPKPFVGEQKDKLIIALQMHELVGALNLALRVRRASFEIDYTVDHKPRLFIARPGVEREKIMYLDVRKHICYITPPRNLELFAIFADITERLHKIGGRLSLTGDKPLQGPRRCMLQIYVDGARTIALTLMETTKGRRTIDTSFQLPDGTTP
jgi:hypothetical protein